ncbi:MAG: hypothetical protein V3W41_20505 [Planctomycetota bacterium]
MPHLLIVAALAGWLNREQQSVLDYLKEENRVLKEQLGTKRLRLTNDQRPTTNAVASQPKVGRSVAAFLASMRPS